MVKLTDAKIRDHKVKGKNLDSIPDGKINGMYVRKYRSGKAMYYYTYRPENSKYYTWVKIGDARNINLETARKACFKMIDDISNGKSPRDKKEAAKKEVTLEAFLSETFYRKISHLKPSTQRVIKSLINCWVFQDCKNKTNYEVAKTLTPLHSKSLKDITVSDAESLKAGVEQKSKQSADKLIKVLRTAFNYAIKLKFISTNPFSEVELNYKIGSAEDNRVYSKSERERILANVLVFKGNTLDLTYYKKAGLNPVHCVLIAYALLTGRRYRSEGGFLKWDAINFETKSLNLTDSKVGAMVYSLSDKAIKLLRAIKHQSLEPLSPFNNLDNWIFPGVRWASNKGWLYSGTHVDSPLDTLKKICKKLKIKYLPLKQARHTFGTELLKSSRNLAVVQAALGHSKISTTGRYAKIAGIVYADEVNKMDQVTETPAAEVVKFKKN